MKILLRLVGTGRETLTATLFDTPVARKFFSHLPYDIKLISWGNESYGPIGRNLGEHKLQPSIPPGGLAYTTQGNYFCIFYGQSPAWPVDHIGSIDANWEVLTKLNPRRVVVEEVEEVEENDAARRE